jgi:type IV secretory pathway VirB10-like protein
VQETEAVVGDTASKAQPQASATPASSDMMKAAKRRPDAAGSRAARSSTSVARNDQAPTLTSTWPSSQAPAPTQAPPPVPPIDPAARPDDRVVQEPVRPPEPPKPTFEELVIARDSVIGLQTENRIASDTAHVEDRVDARVTRDVRVGNRIAIPAGSRVIGSVTQVDRGGKFKEQARLGIRFHTIMLADGTRLPISTETIVRLGEAPANGSAAKIGGGAVGGAILGAILGGAKGAAIGATAGAGAGTAAVSAGDRSAVVLPPGTQLTPRILSPVTVTVER